MSKTKKNQILGVGVQNFSSKARKILGLRNLIFFSFAIFLIAPPAFALPLVPCGTEFVPCTPCHLFTLADRIVDFVLKGLALPILVIALLAGGVVWVTAAGNTSQIEKGRKILTSGIVGIFIAFGAWLIVDTIIVTLGAKNAEFKVGQNITIGWAWNEIEECPPPIVSPPTTGGGGGITVTPPTGTFQTDEEARQLLINNGVPVNKGDCPTPQATTCTSLKGLPKYVVTKLIQLQTECFNVCPFVVTGGTETGHKEHGQGQPVVDIVPAKNNKSQGAFLALSAKLSSLGGVAYCEAQGGARISDCKPPTNHIHVSFSPK